MSLIRRTSSLFPSFSDFFDDDFFTAVPSRTANVPAVNIKEDDNAFNIEVAAPGLTKNDFKINVDNRILTISSETKKEDEEKGENFTKKEFSYSAFTRSFTLPETVKEEEISAKYEDGILKLTLPKLEEAKTKAAKEISIS